MAEEELLPFCECGVCGLRVTKKGNRFIWGHNRRGIPHTPETCVKMSEWQKGVPKSPEHNAVISKTLTDIPHTSERIAAITKGLEDAGVHDRQRGGNDLVNHHYIYDESDLSLNTVQMKRSDHSRLHHLLKKLGYIIPHINLPDEPTKETRDDVL